MTRIYYFPATIARSPATRGPLSGKLADFIAQDLFIQIKNDYFIKHFAFFPGANYPDYGCNAEFYTEPGMLEIESLGPEVPVEPGDFAEHIETWQIEQVAASEDDDALAEQLKPFGL